MPDRKLLTSTLVSDLTTRYIVLAQVAVDHGADSKTIDIMIEAYGQIALQLKRVISEFPDDSEIAGFRLPC